VYFVLYVFVLYFVLYLYFLAPATRDRCGGRKRGDAVPPSRARHRLGGGGGAASIRGLHFERPAWSYHFVSQHTYKYHIGPQAHVDVDTDSDSRQQQQPPAPAVAQIIQNNTKSSLLYYVLYKLIVSCIVLCIMFYVLCISDP
jgi:hypothetical protein